MDVPDVLENIPGENSGAASVFNYAGARPEHRVPRALLQVGVMLAVLLGGVFYWTFGQMWVRWNSAGGYYSHGPLVIPIAAATAWLIVRKRGLPLAATAGSRRAGLAMLAGALAVHLACMYARVTFVSGFMLPVALAGAVAYLGGWGMLRRVWFPIAFLGFMVPLPDITIYNINFYLKIYAAEKSTGLVNAFGAPAFRKGSEVYLEGGKHLTVEDVCSGLRSLIALLAFAMLFTYACRVRGWKRVVLFCSAAPIAVVANIVRITVLLLVANGWGVALAVPGGWVHDTMGFAVFVVAFCLMFLEEEALVLLPGGERGSWLFRTANGAGASGGAPSGAAEGSVASGEASRKVEPEITPRRGGPTAGRLREA